MDKRYKMFAKRALRIFLDIMKKYQEQKMRNCQIVIIIDELADLIIRSHKRG